MSEQATARPWVLNGDDIYSADGDAYIAELVDWDDPSDNPAEQAANAELIVRAVNAHDALVVALLKLTNEASGFVGMASREIHGNTNIAVLNQRISEAREALKLAEAVE